MKEQKFWKNLVALLILSSLAYIFMEWLFIVTMPSFMDDMSLVSKLEIMFAASGVLACIGLAPVVPLALIDLGVLKSEKPGMLLFAALLVPTLIISALILLLVDNFTYTVFKFGIVDTDGLWRGLYALGFLAVFIYIYRWGLGFLSRPLPQVKHIDSFLILMIAAVVLTGVSLAGQYDPISTIDLASLKNVKERPNILIIGSDGVNAANTSLYGYERDTTPNLIKLAQTSLVAENAFTNGGESMVSVTSILTGKNPAFSSFYREGKVLMGENSYQHLPGILKELGYYSVEIGVPHYIDAYDLNFRGGFDEVNYRAINTKMPFQLGARYGLGSVTYLLETVSDRIANRLLHIFFVRKMVNPFKVVTQVADHTFDDRAKLDHLINLVSNTKTPLFVHVHFMGTHGATFAPVHQIYSAGQQQDKQWMTDFYDDSIYDFDSYVAELLDALAKSGKLDNTILVIYTDHNMFHETNQHIPLVIRFPNGKFAGEVSNNSQNIDIAPTILDYLKIPRPEWMDGLSLLRGDPPVDRLVYSSNIGDTAVTVVDCDRWFRFEHRGVWFTGEVDQHTAPCAKGAAASLSDLPSAMQAYLDENHFVLDDKPESESAYLPPAGNPTLAQIAVLLLQTKYGSAYTPPAPEGLFADVPTSHPLAGWIEQSYRDGMIGACASSPLSYCPDALVTRGQIAEYLLKAKNGKDYVPSPATGIFQDVPKTSQEAAWIEELYRLKITSGCSVEPLNYCPDMNITSSQFTVFLNMIFELP
jgi:arylsulfatase A-like enzyme